MRHRTSYNPLSRKAAHRKAMLRNMTTSLIRHERIKTTRAKAREVRRKVEKIITRAKVDSVHNRRMAARDIRDKAALNRLFTEVGPRFSSRPGGYTRILKLGQRYGDAAEVVILELVARTDTGARKKRSREKAVKAAAAEEATEQEAAVEEESSQDESAEEEREEKAEK